MDLVPPLDVRSALRSLFLHLFPADAELAGDRVDVVLLMLDTWDRVRVDGGEDGDGHEPARAWARAHVERGFAAAARALGDAEEVPYDEQPDALPPELVEELAWAILVEPAAERFGAGYRAALALTWGCREWTVEVDALAGHLLLVHGVDARPHRRADDDRFDLLLRLWAVHLPLADIDICFGDEIEHELGSD